jgi:methyltransferase
MRTSETLYLLLVGAVALARLAELRLAERNRRTLVAQGAIEAGAAHYPWMVALHALFLAAAPLEVLLLRRPFRPLLGIAMLVLLAAAMTLRYAAIATLGGRWTTRILVVPGLPPVASGPYRFLRHPNYVAVVLEMAALPLVHGAWWTACVFSLANLLLLRVRIHTEERALTVAGPYASRFAATPRFVPGIR